MKLCHSSFSLLFSLLLLLLRLPRRGPHHQTKFPQHPSKTKDDNSNRAELDCPTTENPLILVQWKNRHLQFLNQTTITTR